MWYSCIYILIVVEKSNIEFTYIGFFCWICIFFNLMVYKLRYNIIDCVIIKPNSWYVLFVILIVLIMYIIIIMYTNY